jgi:hypothetical protein
VQRSQLLRAALGFAGLLLSSYDRALHALRSWWAGIGRVVVGMALQGHDLQLTRYDEKGWRATFDTQNPASLAFRSEHSGRTYEFSSTGLQDHVRRRTRPARVDAATPPSGAAP